MKSIKPELFVKLNHKKGCTTPATMFKSHNPQTLRASRYTKLPDIALSLLSCVSERSGTRSKMADRPE